MNKSKILILFVITILFACSSTKKESPKLVAKPERALELTCSFSPTDNGRYVFIINAKRLRTDSLERFPSAEHVRLSILDSKGMCKYRSDNKSAYSSQITAPLPDTVGHSYDYIIYWDGNGNDNNILPTGRYKAELMLACMPRPYMTTIEFDWKNPYDR